jgi:hypothetical protein
MGRRLWLAPLGDTSSALLVEDCCQGGRAAGDLGTKDEHHSPVAVLVLAGVDRESQLEQLRSDVRPYQRSLALGAGEQVELAHCLTPEGVALGARHPGGNGLQR